MVSVRSTFAALLITALGCTGSWVRAETVDAKSQAEMDAIQHDIDTMRAKLVASKTAQTPSSQVDRVVENKYGPDASVTTRSGKLTVSGMVQAWYYWIQKDNRALFDNAAGGIADTNEASDNNGFRIRRTELKFTMDIHENITAVLMMDPAREATSFPSLPDNQANGTVFKRLNNVAPEFAALGNPGSTTAVSGVQTGSGQVPRLLQDAYINFHGVIPHHDLQIGQFKPPIGDEALRSSAELDFVERSFIGQLGDFRDGGAQVHGTWWDDRVQYWVGAFNGAGNYFGSGNQYQNRSDDNDQKDVATRLLVRPLWQGPDGKWGRLELGVSNEFGSHGEAGERDSLNSPVNGLNRVRTAANRTNAFATYMPGGPVKGWWIRGEWTHIHDRNTPNAVIDLLGQGTAGSGAFQSDPKPFSVEGWNVSTGYRFHEGCGCGSMPSFAQNIEIAFRYESFQNVLTADLVDPAQTDVFTTQVYTSGVNYYIRGNTKIQANYNIVRNPDGTSPGANRQFHNVKNDNFVVNFQVAF